MIGFCTRLTCLCFAIILSIGAAPHARAQRPGVKEFYQDFRGKKPLSDDWTLVGSDSDKEGITPENTGLRVQIQKTRKSFQPVGVRLAHPWSGDFEMIARYEIVALEKPPPDAFAVGVAINLLVKNDAKQFAKLGRFLRNNGEHAFLVECLLKEPPRPTQHAFLPAAANTGRLRLVREGAQLRYQAADGDEAFEEIYRGEYTDADLEIVRFAANNNNGAGAVDVRLLEVCIRTLSAAPVAPDAGDGRGPIAAKQAEPQPSRLWLVVASVIGFSILLLFLIAIGAMIFLKRRAEPTKKNAKVA